MKRPVLMSVVLAGLMLLVPGVQARSSSSSVCDEDSEAASVTRPTVLRDARAVLAALAESDKQG